MQHRIIKSHTNIHLIENVSSWALQFGLICNEAYPKFNAPIFVFFFSAAALHCCCVIYFYIRNQNSDFCALITKARGHKKIPHCLPNKANNLGPTNVVLSIVLCIDVSKSTISKFILFFDWSILFAATKESHTLALLKKR